LAANRPFVHPDKKSRENLLINGTGNILFLGMFEYMPVYVCVNKVLPILWGPELQNSKMQKGL